MDRWKTLGGLTILLVVASVPASPQGQAPSGKIKAVLWVGGFAHDFDAFAAAMMEFLPKRIPIEMDVVRDGRFLDSPEAGDLDVIVMNHCFESTQGVLNEVQQRRLLDLVRGGVGVVAVHASYYSFVEWDAVRELYGARFTQHGSSDIYVQVRIVDREHPITRDLPETFRVRTELYQSTPLAKDCHLLAQAREEGAEQEYPTAWTRTYGKGRVVTILPAHWPEAYSVEPFQKLIANSIGWAANRPSPPEAREEGP